MSKKVANPSVMATHIKRQPKPLTSAELDARAHAAALHVIDVCDAVMNGPIPSSYGPRTATHPQATRVEPDTRGPQSPATHPTTPVIHAAARAANSTLVLIGAMTAFMAGVALGKAL